MSLKCKVAYTFHHGLQCDDVSV